MTSEMIIPRLALVWAAAVVVPLGVSVIGASGWPVRWARRVMPWAAAALSVGLFTGAGRVAGMLALPWAGAMGLLGAEAGRRVLTQRWRSPGEAAQVVALALVPIGGAWALIAAAGLRPMGFEEPIVTLTAVHFHYAAFALPAIVGALRGGMPERGAGARRARWAAVGAIGSAVPALALGITASPVVEVLAAGVLLATVAGLAGWMAWIAAAVPSVKRGARVLLALSAASALAAIGPALAYALGEAVGHVWIGVSTVGATHGISIAAGFAPFGLLACRALGEGAAIDSTERTGAPCA